MENPVGVKVKSSAEERKGLKTLQNAGGTNKILQLSGACHTLPVIWAWEGFARLGTCRNQTENVVQSQEESMDKWNRNAFRWERNKRKRTKLFIPSISNCIF